MEDCCKDGALKKSTVSRRRRRRVARWEGEGLAKYERAAKEGNCKGKQSMTQAKCIPVDDKQKCIGAHAPVCCHSVTCHSVTSLSSKDSQRRTAASTSASHRRQQQRRASSLTGSSSGARQASVLMTWQGSLESFRDSGRARATPSPRPPVASRGGGRVGGEFGGGNTC